MVLTVLAFVLEVTYLGGSRIIQEERFLQEQKTFFLL